MGFKAMPAAQRNNINVRIFRSAAASNRAGKQYSAYRFVVGKIFKLTSKYTALFYICSAMFPSKL